MISDQEKQTILSTSASSNWISDTMTDSTVQKRVNLTVLDEVQYDPKVGEEGFHMGYVNILKGDPDWTPPPEGQAGKFLYGPVSAIPISYLNNELGSIPLIPQIYDELGKLTPDTSGSGNSSRKLRKPAYDSSTFERMGNKSNAGKLRSHISHARQFVDFDRITSWSD